jgi:hypothetical protein
MVPIVTIEPNRDCPTRANDQIVARAVLAAADWFLTKVKLSGKPQPGVQPSFTVVA